MVPPIWARRGIVRKLYESLGCPGGQRVYELLRQCWFWSGMNRDCVALCTGELPSQIEGARFPAPPHLVTTKKDLLPFDTRCIDTIGPINPPGTEGAKHLIVCVCAASKWVEAWPVVQLTSHVAAALFHLHVTCRFGVPRVVRSDRGREFQGRFKEYLAGLGVDQRLISTAHPRANGLVERYNKVVKEGLRKLSSLQPNLAWDELLPEVLAGLRMLPTRTGASPHLLCFKQPATWLAPVAGGVCDDADVSTLSGDE